jgi:serine phosphatase RsbU (regulator of sigma subunit)
VRYEPATRGLEVGGDWYDVVELAGGAVGVFVGDVVGHGLPAATVMGQLRSAARALLLQLREPASVLEALDRFAALVPGARCSTVFCAVLDRADDTVRYSSAGHLPALLLDAGHHVLLGDALAVPLAVLRGGLTRPTATARLPPDSTLLLYTDGLVERRHEDLDQGIGRAVEALRQVRGERPERITEHLWSALLHDGHDDDVAYLVYRHRPGGDPVARSGADVTVR